MKKSVTKYLILFLLFFSIPTITKAYTMEAFYIDATLEENGDLTVQEYIILNGEFNGFKREIYYQNSSLYAFNPNLDYYGGSTIHNGDGILLDSIYALEIDKNFDFTNIDGTKFEHVFSKKQDYGVYEIFPLSKGESYKIFLPNTKNQAFYLKYTLNNMAVMHEDVGELYWTVIGDDLEESIKELRIAVHFKNNQNELRVWAHGPLNGTVQKLSNDTLYAVVKGVNRNNAVDVRAVFDKSVIPSSKKITGVNALDKILNYEMNKANQANYEREQEDFLKKLRAEETIKYCLEDPTKNCYERSKSLSKEITDAEIKENLNQKLNELLTKVIKKEEQIGNELITNALENPRYSSYKNVLETIEKFTESEVKVKLLNQLELVKEKVIETEIQKNKILSFIGIPIIIILIIIIICLYYYCDKEEDSTFKEKYLRDFPNDFSPTTVSYLFHKRITKQAISAEILNLIYKKAITIEKLEFKDYKFIKNLEYKEPLSEKEASIMDFLFHQKDKIKLSTLRERGKYSHTFVLNKWDDIEEKSLKEALKEKIYVGDSSKAEKRRMYPLSWGIFLILLCGILMTLSPLMILPGILFLMNINRFNIKNYQAEKKKENKENRIKLVFKIIAILLIFISINVIIRINEKYYFKYFALPFYWVIVLISFAVLLYIPLIKKKTKKGKEAYQRWKAFKRFLKHFGNFEQKELPEIHLWERFLAYATVLGCSKKLSKKMELKMENQNINYIFNDTLDLACNISLISYALSSSLTVANKIELEEKRSAFTSSSSDSSSNSSSGSGEGGGFSSGGGSGGGGGGGSRF